MLEGEAVLYKHGKAETLYLAIPSKVATDSSFPFKKGDRVNLRIEYGESDAHLEISKAK